MEKDFSSSTLAVMDDGDHEDSVCIELEDVDNQLELEEVIEVIQDEEMGGEANGFLHKVLLQHKYILDKTHSPFAILIAMASAFAILCVILHPILVITLQHNNNHTWEYNRKDLGDIYLTKEYQIKLAQDLFIPRDTGVETILRFITENSNFNVYNVSKHHIGVRSQYKYNPWNCTNWQQEEQYEYSEFMSAAYYEENGHGYLDAYGYPNKTNDHDDPEKILSETELRVRNWLSVQEGSGEHTSSIDIKKQVEHEDEAFLIPFYPADDQKEGSTEKLETDIKKKSTKYSHKCKVTNVPYYPSFSTCRDVMRYWPGCFPDLPEELYDTPIERKTHSENYWWEDLRESHDPRTGLKFRLTITMEYETFAQALEGRYHPIDEPEASFRIWSSEDGHGPWDPKIVSEVNRLYKLLVKEFYD